MSPPRLFGPTLVLLSIVTTASANAQSLSGYAISQTNQSCRKYIETDPPKDKTTANNAAATVTACLQNISGDMKAIRKQVYKQLTALPGAPDAAVEDKPPAAKEGMIGWNAPKFVAPQPSLEVTQKQASGTTITPNETSNPAVGSQQSESKWVAETEFNAFLIARHYHYKRLRKWVEAITDTSKRDLADDALDETDTIIHWVMGRRELLQLFSAALMQGAVFGQGDEVNTTTSSEGETSTRPVLHVAWESKHFGDDGGRAGLLDSDVSFGGKFGFVPALLLLREQGESIEEAVTEYKPAFQWDMNGRVNLHVGGEGATGSELSGYIRIGQTWLNTDAFLVDKGEESVLSIPVGGSDAEWFYEFGIAYNLYDNPLDVLHAEKGLLNPTFRIGAAYRLDNRFKISPADQAQLAFNNADRRFVFSFAIDALKLVDKRPLAKDAKTFTFGFGLEYEKGLGSDGTIPGGTKLVLRGDLNLLRALRGEGDPPK